MNQVNAWYPYISNTGKSVIWLSWDIYESKQQESKCLKLIITFSPQNMCETGLNKG